MAKSSGPKPIFDDLKRVIEEISHIKFDDVDIAPIDLKTMRAREAAQAAKEIAIAQAQKRRSWIDSIHKEGLIDSRYTFEKIVRDELNLLAVQSAEGFCYTTPSDLPVCFIIRGNEGSGKTVLSHAIANKWLELTGQRVMIASMDDIRKSCLFSSNEIREERLDRDDKWELYCSVSLLVLDGLCANREQLSAFDQKIFATLLRTRHQRGLNIVITTQIIFNQLGASLGSYCSESLKEFSVVAVELFGGSRRQPIIINGRRLL